ncbi:PDZ domain-containing protein [Spirosoma sp. BT702]|uniref:PDZ domain-containing protein n=1 Tax=Spirosoma profusum TaxID=2771354 RepID=A0A927ATC5_9BACT|nr:S41 family peptidase [Spirosoma profusum]MBD2699852.1 PDZ domain-containing protein [Spirosoma profusum]
MNVMTIRRSALLLSVVATLLMASCRKPADVTPATDAEVKEWILSNMQTYYFWNDRLPANPDKSLAPSPFFYSLLYNYNNTAVPDRDRFSWIQASADELKASLSGQSKTTGMEYRYFYRDQTQSSVGATVLYVLPGSPAAKAGIKRGDIITKVNGQSLTGTNYTQLISSSVESYTFGFATLKNGVLTDTDQTKQVTPIVFQEDPVLLDTTYIIGSKTIGYVVYNQFTPGAFQSDGSTNNAYDQKLDAIFGKFKQKGVNEMILDLRYNRGGYVSSATNLASLMGKNIDANKVFYSQKWNSNVMADRDKQSGVGWNNQKFVTKSTAIGSNLSRLYVLTTGSTASASELIINGLRPFMTVNTIGTTTVGKNVGSITISDKTGAIKWGMQPITFKSANALGFTDYGNGFTPAVEVKEPLIGMKALGDLTESLLSEAIFQISGTRTARRGVDADVQESIGSSLDRKAGGGNMFIEN